MSTGNNFCYIKHSLLKVWSDLRGQALMSALLFGKTMHHLLLVVTVWRLLRWCFLSLLFTFSWQIYLWWEATASLLSLDCCGNLPLCSSWAKPAAFPLWSLEMQIKLWVKHTETPFDHLDFSVQPQATTGLCISIFVWIDRMVSFNCCDPVKKKKRPEKKTCNKA